MSDTTGTGELSAGGYEPRKRGVRRRELFIETAMDAFVANGFEGTSLQEIVTRTGGSLATLYRLFGNKEGLFRAVIERKFEQAFGAQHAFELSGRPAEEALFTVGMSLLGLVLSDEAVGVHRLMIAESARAPGLRDIFMELAPNRGKAALADYFNAEKAAGRLRIDDCELAAAQFLGLVKADYLMRRLLGEEIRLGEKQRTAIVRQAVDSFLSGVRPR